MSASNFIQVVLSCGSETEAASIARALLEKHLIACAKAMPVKSENWWQGELESGDEILLLMESVADNFDQIEKSVKAMHSYDTPMLYSVPMTDISADAAKWLKQETDSQAAERQDG